uniref:hypothetical protein n=1 Tax=Candidatus Ichthyocystis sparus TaxID=1561004 RepID=UPI0011467F89
MYSISATSSAVAPGCYPESEDDSSNRDGTLQGGYLQKIEAFPAVTVGDGMSTKDRGKASSQKHGTSVVVSSSAVTIDSGVLSSLGVVLPPESEQVIEDIFLEVDLFARSTYKSMVARQLPLSVSDKLTLTGRAIWHFTYREMCESNFVSRCIGEYHHKHRPDFVRSLPNIQVLSNSPGRSVVSLTGGGLLDFLSRLDAAIHSKVKSVFASCWSEVSVTLEEESLSAVSCGDFVSVLNIAGIPPLSMSQMLMAEAKSARRKGRAKSRGTIECAASGVNATDLAYSSPSGTQSLPSQPCTELSSTMHSQSESRAEPSLPSGEASGTTYELTFLSSVGDSGVEFSSDLIATKVHKDDGVSVSTSTDTGVVLSTVEVPPIPSEAAITLASSAISPSYHCASLSVQCVHLPGIKLHPDSAKLIGGIFCEIRKFARSSFSHSIFSYISTMFNSELPVIGKAIWFKTYKELHLSKFMCKFICVYHYRCHPNLIRALDSILVLSSSSDSRLVPLSGVELLGFLSKLDCAIRKEVESIFDFEWNELADKVFSELEDRSLGDVGCGDFINVLDVVGVPVAAFSIYQRYVYPRCLISKGKSLGSGGSECAVDVTESRSLLLPGEDCYKSSSKFVKFPRDQSGSASTTSAVSKVVTSHGGTDLFLPVTDEITSTIATTTTGKRVSTSSKGESPVPKCGSSIDVSSSALTIFVKFPRDQSGSASTTSAVSKVVTSHGGIDLSLPVTDEITSTIATTTTGKRVSTSSKGKSPVTKCGASIDVSSSDFTIDSDVLSSLGVTLSPE